MSSASPNKPQPHFSFFILPFAFPPCLRASVFRNIAPFAAFLLIGGTIVTAAEPESPLSIRWKDNYLTIAGPHIPGGDVQILYLEAYCRPGSTDRDWHETVIGHKTELISAEPKDAPTTIKLRDVLRDGVIVEHTITAGKDEVDFRLVANNPTKTASEAHWAQPCIRLDKFTGTDPAKARELHPPYIHNCFLFVDGKLTRLPTEPWAKDARYTPGQVFVPKNVDRNDVNPRPLSKLVPSSGLCGCFSADGKQILAVAWEPYQEIFQGVITCLHSDFRLGGLQPGETKKVRGKIYITAAEIESLVKQYNKDFPEQAK
jgi:hypothetical protein